MVLFFVVAVVCDEKRKRGFIPVLNVLFAYNFYIDELTKHLGIKKPPDYGQEATQMFSQRNNPYCDLLSKFVLAKINKVN